MASLGFVGYNMRSYSDQAKAIVKIRFENILILFLIPLAADFAIYHIELILFPFQAELREGAMIINMKLFSSGQNLFSIANKPVYAESYGVIYYVFSYPFVKMLGTSLQTLRTVSGVAIVLTCGLVFGLAYIRSRSLLVASAAASLCYPGLCYYVTPVARPDAVGTFLFLLAIAIPWYFRFSLLGLALAGVLTIACFLTKAYFLLSFAIIFSYLLLFVSTIRAIAYFLVCAFFITSFLAIVEFSYYTYFCDVIFPQISGVSNNHLDYMRKQFWFFGTKYWSFPVIMALGAIVLVILKVRGLPHWTTGPDVGGREPAIRDGLLARARLPFEPGMGYFGFASVWAVAACIYPLGGSVGAWLTYFFQLIMPCAAIAVGEFVGGLRGQMNEYLVRAVAIATAALLALNTSTAVAWRFPHTEFSEKIRNWESLEAAIVSYRNVLHSPVIASVVFSQKKPVYDTGLTEYFTPGLTRQSRISGNVALRVRAWKQGILRGLRERRFDLVVTHRDERGVEHVPAFASKALIHANYKPIGSYLVVVAIGNEFLLDFWVPRESP